MHRLAYLAQVRHRTLPCRRQPSIDYRIPARRLHAFDQHVPAVRCRQIHQQPLRRIHLNLHRRPLLRRLARSVRKPRYGTTQNFLLLRRQLPAVVLRHLRPAHHMRRHMIDPHWRNGRYILLRRITRLPQKIVRIVRVPAGKRLTGNRLLRKFQFGTIPAWHRNQIVDKRLNWGIVRSRHTMLS